MKKIYFVLSALLVALITVFIPTEVKASPEFEFNDIVDGETIALDIEDDSEKFIHLVSVTIDNNGGNIFAYVKNMGKDTLDKVHVNAKVRETGLGTTKTLYNLRPGTTKISLPINMLKINENIDVKVSVTESGQTKTLSYAHRRYINNTALNNWHRGTFPSLSASLDYHFREHKSEIPVYNMADYVQASITYRTQVMANVANGNASSIYTMTDQNKGYPATKYKHKTDRRFAILKKDDFKIFSFGR